MGARYIPEPFRIKMVETIKMLSREEREEKIAKACYNMFNLRGEDCYIDLLTDSGTNAMSADQWAGIMKGDEAYAGASSYFKLIDAGRDIFGYEYIQPVHQGRAAEKVLFGAFLHKGLYAISNMFFDTTRAHVELTGARAIDCMVEEAKNPSIRKPFKGNMDVNKMEEIIRYVYNVREEGYHCEYGRHDRCEGWTIPLDCQNQSKLHLLRRLLHIWRSCRTGS